MEIRIDPVKAAGVYETVSKDIGKKDSVRSNTEKYDKINISPEAQKFGEASKHAAAVKTKLTKDDAQDRVNEIKAAIKDGSYNVSSEKIARAMLGVIGG